MKRNVKGALASQNASSFTFRCFSLLFCHSPLTFDFRSDFYTRWDRKRGSEDDSHGGKRFRTTAGRWRPRRRRGIAKCNLEVGLRKDAEGSHSYDVSRGCEAVTRPTRGTLYPRPYPLVFAVFAIYHLAALTAKFILVLIPCPR